MEISSTWRRGKGAYKLLTGVKFIDGVDLRKQMVEAGRGNGTADDALNAFYSYINRKQRELLAEAISDRTLIEVEMLVMQEV